MSTDSITAEPEFMPANATIASEKPKRFHPALVALHWLIAILIFGAFFLVQGGEGDRGRFRPGQGQSNFQPQIQGQGFPQGGFPQQGGGAQGIFSTIGFHMIFGLTVLILLVVRLIVRWTTKHPEWASAGNKYFDWIGVLTHWGLYILTFGMVITGIILADQRGQLVRTFGIGSTPVCGAFGRGGFSLGMFHGGIWILLVLLMAVHIGAALYHQFILKDNYWVVCGLGRRMNSFT